MEQPSDEFMEEKLEELELIEGEMDANKRRINELLIQTGLAEKTYEDLLDEKKKRKQSIKDAKQRLVSPAL
jgi:hypothetical protein